MAPYPRDVFKPGRRGDEKKKRKGRKKSALTARITRFSRRFSTLVDLSRLIPAHPCSQRITRIMRISMFVCNVALSTMTASNDSLDALISYVPARSWLFCDFTNLRVRFAADTLQREILLPSQLRLARSELTIPVMKTRA